MPKRQRGFDRPLEEERQPKANKRAAGDESNAGCSKDQRDTGSDKIAITVSFRSSSRAARNDPKPESYWQRMLQTDMDDRESSTTQSPAGSPSNTLSGTFPGIGDDYEQANGGNGVFHDEKRWDFNSNDTSDEQGQSDDDESRLDDADSWTSSVDIFAEFPWLEQIDATVKEGVAEIATCDAKLIRRNQIVHRFWADMEEPTQETSCLAFELFDRYGRLKRQYYEHSFKRGSGVWGREMDRDDILLFESINVELPYHRRGLATQLVQAILDKVRPKTTRFVALAKPGHFVRGSGEEAEREMERQQRISEQFFRSLGFRRVGTSTWFAFVDDADHASRQLKASEDWDEPEASHNHASIPETARTTLAALSSAESSGDESVRLLQSSMPADTQDASWSAVDGHGNNLLHLAAMNSKLEAVRYILSRRPDVASQRNGAGDTPLEALQSEMELTRTVVLGYRVRVCSDRFSGFTQPSIACVAALSQCEILDLDELSPEVINEIGLPAADVVSHGPQVELVRHSLRLKYGCTCGECIGGFFSPRMLLALLCQAEIQHDQMMDSFGVLRDGPDWVRYNEDQLQFLPASVKENLKTNRSMREGFINTCGHIAECLRRKMIPNERNVRYVYRKKISEWPPVTRNYFQRGGTIAAVATMLFQFAMIQDECSGDGHHWYVFEGEIAKLPECRNDHEFGFASGMCGYKRISTVVRVDLLGNPIEED